MPLQATSGAASYDGFGGGVAAIPNYIEDVFSTYLYTGNGSTQTITNGIDLSTYGGLTWLKRRDSIGNHVLYDTVRGATKVLTSNNTDAEFTASGGLTTFGTTGFTLGTGYPNTNTATFASWTFRKQPKFFDVVTWTGDDAANRQISHSLGSVPGCIIVKRTDASATWRVWHQNMVSNSANLYLNQLNLNTTDAVNSTYGEVWGTSNNVTSTTFQVGSLAAVNATGGTYVAYLFAHNAGGFGLTGTDNVISCGSYTGTGSPVDVNLGYEAQWVLIKRTDSTGNWYLMDTMRGMSMTNALWLYPNSSSAEVDPASAQCNPTATGFTISSSGSGLNAGGGTYIYIAIRRGPMKVPTDATTVFKPVTATGNALITTNFPVDSAWLDDRSGGSTLITDRLRGSSQTYYNNLATTSTSAENTGTGAGLGFDNNTGYQMNGWAGPTQPTIAWNWRRAPSFFDEVCYTGTGVNGLQVAHNLGVAPELIIIKSRGNANWQVSYSSNGYDGRLYLNTTDALLNSGLSPVPASGDATYITLRAVSTANSNAVNYVAYLFATCAGVSKVGSYTGTGSTQTISCGFTSGARFVLIKRTDSTGNWGVLDTARGMVSGTDPYLNLNTTAAEVNANNVYTTTGGFQLVSSDANFNANGGTYLFLAIS